MGKIVRSKGRGPLVLIVIGIIFVLVLIIGIITTNRNFDNDKIKGNWAGTLTIEEQPLYFVNLTLDGNGNFQGTILMIEETLTYNGTYRCMGSDVQMSFRAKTYVFTFIGVLEGEDTIIRGTVSMYDEKTEVNREGGFFFSKAGASS